MSNPGSGSLFGGTFGRGFVRADDQAWLQAMLDAEAALARAVERAGLAAAGAGAAVTTVARAELFDVAELGRRAADAGNPVPALVRMLAGLLPADAAAAVHRGATSQDIIDTAAMLLIRDAIDVIEAGLAAAARSAAALAALHARTVMAGRTLLQQAVPVTFGLVAAGWLTAIDDARTGLRRVRAERLAVQFGGAAGTLAALGTDGPVVAELFADELGLPAPDLPWHTDRLRIIDIAAALTAACAGAGKVARDVTLLAQSEVGEVSEATGGGRRGGSSAMPHKRNPVAAISLLGCAKRAPGLLATLAAAAEQEHQRAAGSWHSEWETIADLLRLTGSAVAWLADLLGGLTVDADRMRANLDAAGDLPLAESVATMLAPSLGHLAAHDLVAAASRRAAADRSGLADALFADPASAARLAAAGISQEQVAAALRPEASLGAAGQFIDRALRAHDACDARLDSG